MTAEQAMELVWQVFKGGLQVHRFVERVSLEFTPFAEVAAGMKSGFLLLFAGKGGGEAGAITCEIILRECLEDF